MTPNSSTQEPATRQLHASVLKRRQQSGSDFLLSDEELRFAADCERMRVDRNRSVLSVLLVKLHEQNYEELAFFARVLEGRIRVTDTPGLLADGRVAILLPDTPAEGAWKVATDISEVYPPGPGRPECEVLVYPDRGRNRDHDADDDQESNGQRHQGAEQQVASGGAKHDADDAGEFFFAKAHPFWKRSLDVLGGTIGLVASLPILAVAALSVKLTSNGPAFFKQQREGHGGRRFDMWKLRTMHVDAEEQQHELRQYSQQDGPAFKMSKDPRTTAVGRFLRWSSMDELPQFWNVIKGDMSLVGPRPLPTDESHACEGWQRRRLQVMPGMTCTWQVCERGNVTFDEWVRMDLRYVKKCGVLEDLRLLAMTL
ncbi:MAG: sugar transferase, partial [Aeoliella sp.]